MKVLTILGSAALMGIVAIAQAQVSAAATTNPSVSSTTSTTSTTGTTPVVDYGADYSSGYRASTAAEGYLRGWADLARSAGTYNYETSKAMINATEAARRAGENRKMGVEYYFDVRRTNAERRAIERGPRATMADLARYAQAGMPRQLSPSELDPFTGQVAWPILLRSADFAEHRENIQKILAERAAMGTLSTDEFLRVNRLTDDMLELLKEQIRDVPTGAYMTARRFLQSLGYEVSQPSTRLAAQLSAPALVQTP